MPLTRSFKETVKARAAADPAFRVALLTEGVQSLLSGDIETGKAILRDYINATVGFEALAGKTGTPPKSLMRMLGPEGNPNARNLMSIIGHLQKSARLNLEVHALLRSRPVPQRRRAGRGTSASSIRRKARLSFPA